MLTLSKKKSESGKISKPENISELPDEWREKIYAEDLQSYIEEQTDGQCDRVSFKKTSPQSLTTGPYFGVMAISRAGNPVAPFIFVHVTISKAPAGATLSRFVMTSTCNLPLDKT